MIGTGEHATIINVKRGDKVMLHDGTIITASTTPEEQMRKVDKGIDDFINEQNSKGKILSLFKRK